MLVLLECEARALLAEFGISTPAGVRDIGSTLTQATEQAPILMQPTLPDLIQEIGELEQRLKRVDQALAAYATSNPDVQVLLGIQGIGVIIITAFVARVSSIHILKRGRSFSWPGRCGSSHGPVVRPPLTKAGYTNAADSVRPIQPSDSREKRK